MERLSNIGQYSGEKISITDLEEAKEFIGEMIKKGERPCVSVPERYTSALKEGLKPHSSWIPGFNSVVGTLGREPYQPKSADEKRVIVRVNITDEEKIHPRLTGPDKAFHGVGPIGPDSIEVLD